MCVSYFLFCDRCARITIIKIKKWQLVNKKRDGWRATTKIKSNGQKNMWRIKRYTCSSTQKMWSLIKLLLGRLIWCVLVTTEEFYSSWGLCIRILFINSFLMIPILKDFPEIAKITCRLLSNIRYLFQTQF